MKNECSISAPIYEEQGKEEISKKKAVFFDIDGTLIKDMSSERLFFKHLIAEGIVTAEDILRYARVSLERFLKLKGPQFKSNKYYLKGKKTDAIFELAGNFFKKKLSPHISTKAIKEINNLKDRGYTIILLSGSLSMMVDCFKNYCNADLGVGTQLISNNGVFTGETNGAYIYGEVKADMIKKLEKNFNIDLSVSYAYANHYTDALHMKLVGRPIAANASPKLKSYARKNNWQSIEF